MSSWLYIELHTIIHRNDMSPRQISSLEEDGLSPEEKENYFLYMKNQTIEIENANIYSS